MYSTTDFYTTAVLITCGFKIKEVTSEGPEKRVKRFSFEDSTQLRDTVLAYTNGVLTGNLRGMRNSIEIVKDLVHAR
jgi:hypothetical protein